MNRTVKKIIAVCSSTSKGYKIVTAITLCLYWMSIALSTQPLTNDTVGQNAVALRATLDTLAYFFITHFFIRTYLKINVVNRTLTSRYVFVLLGYISLVSIFALAISFAIGKIDSLQFTDVKNLYYSNSQGETLIEFNWQVVVVIGFLNILLMLIGWVVIYLFWVQQINRKKQQKELYNAQIQQLTNQLNPHFLFNAFNSIRALIYEDKDKAADTVTLLSELFRTHLKAHLNANSTLAEEITVSTNYLTIEKIRLEERLTIHQHIDPQLMSQQLPTLTLLTLVENAIKHGISPNIEPGVINISANIKNDDIWVLNVANSVNAPSKADGTSTGLININKRLKLMFGHKVKMLQDTEDGIYSIRMELPRDRRIDRR